MYLAIEFYNIRGSTRECEKYSMYLAIEFYNIRGSTRECEKYSMYLAIEFYNIRGSTRECEKYSMYLAIEFSPTTFILLTLKFLKICRFDEIVNNNSYLWKTFNN